MGFTQLPHKLRRFGGLNLADKVLLCRAVCWLAVARIWIVMVPFPKLAERLSVQQGAVVADVELLQRVGFAVNAAAGNVPWRSDCFPQAIAAHKLLRRYGLGATIHLGVDRSGEEDLLAHAWVSCGETVVTGGQNLDRYVEIHRLGE